ncbi:MAG: PEGA domain-containing protein [Candidatus Berkelbacteria bacterium]|nr:PEGA domain-containing protein [Candidatus Berkelbacteria bacterium]
MPKKLLIHLFVWFWVILSFTVIALFLIIVASGYSFNYKAKTIEKTGMIIINSDPKEASVYLNNTFKAKTNVKFSYLVPGLYDIRVEKEGYQTWEKTKKLSGGQAIKEIVTLFYSEPKASEATANEIDQIAKKDSALVANNNFPQDLPQNAKDSSFSKNKKALLYRSDNEIWLYYPDRPEKDRNEIVARFSKNITKVGFLPDYEHIIFIIDKELRIIEFDGTNNLKLANLKEDNFWILDSDREIFYKDNEKIMKLKVR